MKAFFSLVALAAVTGMAHGATKPAAVIVNGGDSTLDLKLLPGGSLLRNVAGLPTFATGLAVWRDHAYVTGSGDDTIARVDLAAESAEPGWITLPAFSNPWGIAIRDARHGYVVLSALNAVQAFDPTTAELIGAPIEVGNWPQGCVIHGDRLFVGVTGFDFGSFDYVDPSVAAIDLDAWELAGSVATHVNPQDVTSFRGRIYAVCTGDWGAIESAVDMIDPATMMLSGHLEVGGTAGSIRIDRDGVGYLGDSGFLSTGLYTFDAETLALLRGPDDPLTSDPTSALLPDERRGALLSTSYDFAAGTLIDWSWPDLVPVDADPIGGGPVAMVLWDDAVVALEVDALEPNPAQGGELVRLEATAVNNTDAAVAARFELDLYLPDGEAWGGNPVFASAAAKVLDPAVPLSIVLRERLPVATPAGSYSLVGRVFDGDGGLQYESASAELVVE